MSEQKLAVRRTNKLQKWAWLLTFLVGTIFLAQSPLRAADGDLDLSFDGDGKAVTRGSLTGDGGRDVVVQPDGKIVIAGSKKHPNFTLSNIAVVRYNANGSLDTGFGTNGIVDVTFVLNSQPNSVGALSVDLQPDGKILVGGSAFIVGRTDFALVRLQANGALDTTFGDNGRVISDLSATENDLLTSIIYDQNRNKIYATGIARISPAPNGLQRDGFAVARYNLDGSLDTTFNGTGKQTFPVGDSIATVTFLTDAALQADGKIVVTGRAIRQVLQGEYFATARVNADGSLDSSFGDAGIVLTNFPSSSTNAYSVYAHTVSILPNGKIFIAGEGSGFSVYAAAQYNPNGTLDTSFGTDGKIRATGLQILDSVLLSSGKFAVAGRDNNGNWVVGRINANGSLDTSFGTNGIVRTAFDFNGTVLNGTAFALALQTDGKLLVTGGAVDSGSTQNSGTDFFLLARYSNSSTVVPTTNPALRIADFDGDGKSDVSVFRPGNGTWYLQNSTAGFSGAQFGTSTDRIVPADYDGDGKTDLAVYRNGIWYLQRSQAGFTGISFGTAEDIPAPGDYDGDGKADIAVFRPSNGTWYLQRSQAGFIGVQFGQTRDKPVAADYDGDGKTDVAVNRAGIWYIQRSQLGFTGISFGTDEDRPTPTDYDGDGKADVAVFRPSNGTWYLQRSQLGFTGVQFGASNDTPAAGDYDGDGKADVAVFRGGTWYLNRSTAGFIGVSFGATTDLPAPAAFIR